MPDARELILVLGAGIATGATYALIGYAFSLLYRSTGAFNFAAGQIAILGALTYISIADMASQWIAVPAAMLLMAFFGVVVYFGVVRRVDVRGAAPVTLLIMMLGLAIVIENAAPAIWGYFALPSPALIEGGFNVAGAYVPYQRVVLLVLVVLALAVVFFFERLTMVGKALVAAGSDREAALISGVNDRLIQGLAWGLAFGLTALAGILFTPLASARISSAVRFSIYGISAAFVGGLGSAEGALIGGLALGILSSLTSAYVSTQYADAILFASVIAFLIIRPAGLFGSAARLLGPRA